MGCRFPAASTAPPALGLLSGGRRRRPPGAGGPLGAVHTAGCDRGRRRSGHSTAGAASSTSIAGSTPRSSASRRARRADGPAAAAAARGRLGGARGRRHPAGPLRGTGRPASSSAFASTTTATLLRERGATGDAATRTLGTGHRAQRRGRAGSRYLLGLRGPGAGRRHRLLRRRWSPPPGRARACARGECDLALAGGVNLILAPSTTIALARGGMLVAGRPLQDVRRRRRRLRPRRGLRRGGAQAARDAPRDGDRILRRDPRLGGQPGRPQQRRSPRRTARRRQAVIRAALADARPGAGATSTTSRRTAPAPRSATPIEVDGAARACSARTGPRTAAASSARSRPTSATSRAPPASPG